MNGHCCFSGCHPCPGCGHCFNDTLGHSMAHQVWEERAESDRAREVDESNKEMSRDVTFVVTVHSFGKKSTVEMSVAREMGRSLSASFGDSGFTMLLQDGRHVEYDSFGDDGHHPEHPVALKIGGEVVR